MAGDDSVRWRHAWEYRVRDVEEAIELAEQLRQV
jgi:hypothetical protein